MKKAFRLFCVFFLAFSPASFSQTQLTQTEKLATLCKVWGFLKYYHPEVTKGKYNWDDELIKKIPAVEAAKDREQLSNIYIAWIKEMGAHKPAIAQNYFLKTDTQTVTSANTFLTWINDEKFFDSNLDTLLHSIIMNRSTGKNYYVKGVRFVKNPSFLNEAPYDEQINPGKNIRFLALCRYWNMIEYYFPSKYLIGKSWEDVLTQMIPIFYNDEAIPTYIQALRELIASTHDSHAQLLLHPQHAGIFYAAPFMVKIIDKKAVVSKILNDTLARLDDVRYGDVTIAANDTLIGDHVDYARKYISASNDAVVDRDVVYRFCYGHTDSITMTFVRDNKTVTKVIHRYNRNFIAESVNTENKGNAYSMLPGNIGYVHMGMLKVKQVKAMYKAMKNTKAIIFDVRNYPKGTLYDVCKYFGSSLKPFVKFTEPYYSLPGSFENGPTYSCGPRHKVHGYKGRIVVLMNEHTQSHAEFTCLALKTLPCTLIGSQTAGADGNVSMIIFPGGYSTHITGLGVYYPDGTVTQRIGIIPDIEIKPTIKGIQEHRDEVLERALAFINTGK